MNEAALEDLKQYVGFDQRDADNLRELKPHVEPLVAPTLRRFHDQIMQHAETRAIVLSETTDLSRFHAALADWIRALFCGTYDAAYWAERAKIGHTHVRVGLPQRHMLAGMQIVWAELEHGIRGAAPPEVVAKLPSLHKLLMLELTVMLHSYQQSYSDRVRQVEREAVQERLTEAEHLAQIGQLAASLAHEIKNPLAGISGAIQVIRDSLRAAAPHRPILDEILHQISRLDGTVKDLLIYARPKPPRFRRCNLDELIGHMLLALRQQPEIQRVRLEYVNSHPLPPIAVDENQIEQLLTNLLLNAAQASPEGGLVRLIATPLPNRVRLTVEDRGQGMDEEVARRAMEPFFTTKAKGTGLGLSICRKIVETHGGKIAIRSVVGAGTEVSVDLPRQQASDGGAPDDDPRTRG